MKFNIKFILWVVLCIFIYFIIPETAFSREMEDVVYLKDGSIIRGTIIEQVPGDHIKIKTTDGSVFVYKIEKIDRMTKEPRLVKKGGGKSPGLALGLSLGGGCLTSFLVPIHGIGQFYNGDIGKGFLFSGWSIGSWLLMLAGIEDDYTLYGENIDPDDDDSLVVLGLLSFLGSYITSSVDAYNSAKEKSEESRYSKLPNKISQTPSRFKIALRKDRSVFLSFRHDF